MTMMNCEMGVVSGRVSKRSIKLNIFSYYMAKSCWKYNVCWLCSRIDPYLCITAAVSIFWLPKMLKCVLKIYTILSLVLQIFCQIVNN